MLYKLRIKDAIGGRGWNIATQERKICNVETWKTLGKFFRWYPELLSKLGAISFQEYVSKGIIHPVFYVDLVYKLRRVKDKTNIISSGWKKVKRLRRRQYDQVIIERTIGL